MDVSPSQGSSGVKRWARTQFFRIWTALAALFLLGLLFYYSPEWLTWWLRTSMRAIEAGAGLLPYPWGDRAEVALKGFGGSVWLQIALVIVAFRVLMWLIGAMFRALFGQPNYEIRDRF